MHASIASLLQYKPAQKCVRAHPRIGCWKLAHAMNSAVCAHLYTSIIYNYFVFFGFFFIFLFFSLNEIEFHAPLVRISMHFSCGTQCFYMYRHFQPILTNNCHWYCGASASVYVCLPQYIKCQRKQVKHNARTAQQTASREKSVRCWDNNFQ